jgi:hypothetical protein
MPRFDDHIIFDEHRMRQTAEAVFITNPRGYYDADGVLRYMMKYARNTQDNEPGFVGYSTTGGFVLTFWYDTQGRMNVFASVDAYTVLKHLGKI